MAYLIRGKTRIKPRPDEKNGEKKERKEEGRVDLLAP